MTAPISTETLLAKRAELVQQQAKALADLNAITGGLQVIDQLLQGPGNRPAAVLPATPKS